MGGESVNGVISNSGGGSGPPPPAPPTLPNRTHNPECEKIMDAPRQVRISVNGVLQFTAKVSQSEDLNDVATRAAETMRLGHLTAHVSAGQINFLPASVKP